MQTTFGWDLCHRCNYQCPYCGVWQDAANDRPVALEDWIAIWRRVHAKHGPCHLIVSGGEPSVYPGFYDLIRELVTMHQVEICTNLSWDVERLAGSIPASQLTIAPTFHPSFADFEEFFRKAVRVKEYLPNKQIYYVAYPTQIKDMPERSRRLKEQDILLIPLPLRGDGFTINSEEEKKIVEEVTPYRGDKIEYQLQRLSPKGRACHAGQRYAVIRVDGSVDRCSQYHRGEVGNILDPDFELFPSTKPCERDYCPIESQWIAKE